jgi:uncharacterized protein YabN with tetrapyrrole methylase and pyrophosphatase domain
MPSLLVVGLGGRHPSDDWAALLDGRTVVARSLTHSRAALPTSFPIVKDFDHLFDRAPASEIADEVCLRVTELVLGSDVAYLVPGLGFIGDATVSRLAERHDPEIAAGSFSGPPLAELQVVDALLLAVAEEQQPFDTGLVPVDPTRPLLVTNWHGAAVVRQAIGRLERMFGETAIETPDANGIAMVRPRTVLSGPPSFAALGRITARLRRPDGCPWDREQTANSLLPDLREEVEELADAVERGDWGNAREELGDLLLHVLMQAQIAHELGHFSIENVVAGINAKLTRRHPHVFGDVTATTAAEVLEVWQRVKHEEKQDRGA